MKKDVMYYICSPLSAPTRDDIRKNMMKARHYMELVSRQLGYRAVAPHAYLPELLDDRNPCERELGLQFGISLLGLCDGMIVCGEYISNGMRAEIRMAEEKHLPVYFLLELQEGFYFTGYRKGEGKNEMQIL